jgi:hypothetical protein
LDNHFHAPLNNYSRASYSSYPFFKRAFTIWSLENPISANFDILASWTWGDAYFCTHYWACLSNFCLSYLYWEATTASWGSFGYGAHNKACNESNAVLIVKAGDH